MSYHFHQNFHFKYIHKERTSAFTSKGSITLEVALVVPIFFFAILCMSYLFEIMAVQTTMRNALHSVGKELAQQTYSSPIISTYGIEQYIIKNVGAENIERSIIVGTSGIDCSHSRSNWDTAEVNLHLQYDLEIPILMFQIPVITCEETLKIKGWTGLASETEGTGKSQTVFVTDYGTVYHTTMSCTYLDLAIRETSQGKVEDIRNLSGGRYYACEYCRTDTDKLYVTDYGDRYHGSLTCGRLKRTIYAIPIEDAHGLGVCSKCVK